MTTATASIIVMALFGLLIGVILQISRSFQPLGKTGETAPAGPATAPEGGALRGLMAKARQAADESRARVPAMPRSQQVVVLAFYGLIAMLVLVIKLSPVQMNWWVLLGSVFGGFLLAQFVFWLARTNRIGSKPR